LSLVYFLNVGCITQFDYEAESDKVLLVVDGKITQKNLPHDIFLSYSSAYGKFYKRPINGANVILYDGQFNSEMVYETGVGRYTFFGDYVKRVPGRSYFIEIKLPNGKTYRSTPQVMPGLIRPNFVEHKIEMLEEINTYGNVIENNFVSLYINTPISKEGENGYLLWRLDEVYSFTELICHPLKTPWICYVKRQIRDDEIKIFSSENLDGGILSNHRIGAIPIFPDWEFFEKRAFNVAQHTISKQAYDYWNKVKIIATPTGSIFDVPPAPVKGNIYNINDTEEDVLGFFEVSMVDTVRTFTYGALFDGIAITDKCDPYNWRTRSNPECCNCLNLENSDLERPYYW
jgi:hypothetical protein